MKTRYIYVNPQDPEQNAIDLAAEVIRRGRLAAFPTETVYGLGGNGLDPEAVRSIFAAKGRPGDNPLILHIAATEEAERLVKTVTPNAAALMQRFWPGPLTVVLEKSDLVPLVVTGGLNTVAIRLPDSLVARRLISAAGVPVAAPSANTSGRPSPANAKAVLSDLDGKIDMVLDAGPCRIGVESTVVDCTTPVPTLLRPGGITLEMLLEVLGEVEAAPALSGLHTTVPRSPGMKYTHYAPSAPMRLVEATDSAMPVILERYIAEAQATGQVVGALVSGETAERLPDGVVSAVYGPRSRPDMIAARLYDCLRQFDNTPVDVIFAEGIADKGLGLAVMNRMRKAAGYDIIRE
ncbi:L-threonylcarbamoyladenylate synthase [Acetonema longum]|uniref:Threonylcarbamoyl-AMP synthase n=1 Tax=Acetonema longum DSM 6540 TaxID=1009370 RepID=F7NIR2_9FIRM|nr:L-threonylcarbamoyladenylate synthase [Acetonema longum]EGO64035.1 translation factor SUA5 [Acetonema longum DSM 6540]